MTDVLISAGELAELTSKEPCVIIDTRNPDAYGAGHLPNAVNVHEIFTYLATSTPEGIHELKTKFADAFGKAGLSGKETAVIYEQSMNSGFGQSCRGYYLLTMLGYPRIKVLDGGFDAWAAKGLPVTTSVPAPAPASFAIVPEASDILIDAKTMLAALDKPNIALLDVRDNTTPAVAADLDSLATTLRDAVNAVQTDPAGRDLDGSVGAAFFAGTGAADLTVALTDPRGIATARTANPGDNTGAQALLALGDTTFAALGDVTLGDFFGGIQAHAGALARTADAQATIEQTVSDTLSAQRDAVSGVSLEEEFTNLIQFQRGFQAASQLIVVSNHMLDDLFSVLQ